MIFKEKKVEKEEKNPYEWPKSYYMEGSAEQRKQLLDERLAMDESDEIQRIKELFDCRYKKMKDGKYMDVFLKGWLDMSLIGGNLNSHFARKKNEKAAMKVAQMWCLDREEEFGRDLLYDELGHLAGVYISSCLSDTHYQSIIFNIGRMKEDRVKQKIKDDLELIARTIPETLGVKDTFALFERAVSDMERRLL